MTFFNKKTDVMDIELTPYGRYLLSIGKLKPMYYEFVDDDILYDVSASAQLNKENQESAHNRIMNETPKMKTLYLRKGVEEDTDFDYGQTGSVDIRIDEIREEFEDISHNQKGIYALGRSSYNSEKVPGFQLTMFKGEISASVNYLSSSVDRQRGLRFLQIPQIEYEYLITKTTGYQLDDPSSNYDFTSEVRQDGSYDKLQFEVPIMHLKEFNSFYEKENFEIEVFMIMDDQYSNGEKRERLFPLKFVKENSAIVNDMLITDEETLGTVHADTQSAKSDYVGHYFDIEIDHEIPEEELCEIAARLDINNQFIDEELICPDQRTERFDIYASRVRPEDLEDCD